MKHLLIAFLLLGATSALAGNGAGTMGRAAISNLGDLDVIRFEEFVSSDLVKVSRVVGIGTDNVRSETLELELPTLSLETRDALERSSENHSWEVIAEQGQ